MSASDYDVCEAFYDRFVFFFVSCDCASIVSFVCVSFSYLSIGGETGAGS